jgi:hypothetical protein
VGADIKGFVEKNWNSLQASHAEAAAKGPEAEARWWGQVTGRAVFEVASVFVPVTKVATVLKAADKIEDVAKVAVKAPLVGAALKAEILATAGKSLAAAKAVRAMSPAAARELLLSIDDFAARENVLRTIVSDPKLLDVATPPNKATFSSGRVELRAGEFLKSRDWAETYSARTTLEQTSGGRWLDNVKAYDDLISRPAADGVWTTLSRRFAESVSGEVVIIKGDVRPDAVLHAEMKILEAALKTGKVSDIRIIELQTVIEKLNK